METEHIKIKDHLKILINTRAVKLINLIQNKSLFT